MPSFRTELHQQSNNVGIVVPEQVVADPGAAAAFEKLSFTFRKEHARAISEAKAEETKQRRLEKVMAGLRGE